MSKSLTTGMLLAALVMLIISVQSTPVSAEGTAKETSAITQDDLKAAYQAGKADAEDGYDLVFEDGYLAGAQDAIEDPDGARDTLVDTCSDKGGVVAEDLSCIMNPEQYWGPEADDDVPGQMALPATH